MITKLLAALSAALLLGSAPALAQTTTSADRYPDSPMTKNFGIAPLTPTELTRQMSEQLKLNEGQYIKLSAVNRTRQARLEEIQRNTKNDPAGRTAQLLELQAQYEQECRRILTPTQLSHLPQLQPAQPATPAAGSGNGVG